MNKNILNKTRCYLVGPIESSVDYGAGWRDYVTEKMSNINIKCFNPCDKPYINSANEDESFRSEIKGLIKSRDFTKVREIFKVIRRQDLAMVDRADFIIAKFEPDIPTYGSMEELTVAVKMSKPIFFTIGDKSKVPLWVWGMLPENQIFNSLDEIIKEINDINSQIKPVDDKYWRLLKEDFR